MELKDYLEAIRQGWKIVLTVLVLCLVAGAVLAFTQTEEYVSETKLFVAPQVTSKDPDELSERNAIAQQQVRSYVEVINGDVLASRVSRRVGIIVNPEDVIASLASGTVVVDIKATNKSPERARDVAATYASLAPAAIRAVDETGQGAAQVKVTVIDKARMGTPVGVRSPILVLILAALFGLGLGLTAATATWFVRGELGANTKTAV